jgi:predicted metal-dependent hydrolase
LIDEPSELGAGAEPAPRPVPMTEPLEGPDAAFIRRVVDERPALLLVDTACTSLPWQRWIQVLKTSAATRRIPVAAFGPHVDKAGQVQAHDLGADFVVSRGQLQSWLIGFLTDAERRRLAAEAERACDRELSASGQRGLELIQRGEYFEAHEALEQAWLADPGSAGDVYRAVLQVAVLYLHITRDNFRGAAKMLLRMRQWLDPLPARCRGIDVAALRENVEELRRELEKHGPQGIRRLDRRLLRPIPLVGPDRRTRSGA